MPVNYKLYLVTDRGISRAKDIFEGVKAAIKGGVTLVQLREKDVSSLDFYNIALTMKDLTHRYDIPLIINDRLDIALAIDADGLHIGQEDLPLEVARKVLGKDKILGYSVTSVEEAVYGEKSGADYLGAGPVFPTGSKLDAVSPIGIETLKRIRERVAIPVVGIGGIGASNIREVRSSGVAGVSLISAILGYDDIEGAARDLVNLWEE